VSASSARPQACAFTEATTSGISGTGAKPKASIAGLSRPAIVFPGRERTSGGEGASGMSDDVEAKLEALEARLAELEAEAAGTPAPEPAPAPADDPPRAATPPPPAAPPAPPRPAPPADHLEQFGVELRRLSHELVAAYDRVLAHERRTERGRHRMVLEVQADLAGLAALERALAASPAVRAVELQAYAGGHASLVVDLA
jgi:hypothetical protein